jgi:hypothetical protein
VELVVNEDLDGHQVLLLLQLEEVLQVLYYYVIKEYEFSR